MRMGVENMGKMIEVEGFKAFRGVMRVCGKNISGDWLYNPHTECWYGCGWSYPAIMCKVLEVNYEKEN